jgi:hypothetical protein
MALPSRSTAFKNCESSVAQSLAVIEQCTVRATPFSLLWIPTWGRCRSRWAYPKKMIQSSHTVVKFTCKTLLASHETFKRIFLLISPFSFSFPAHKSYIREGCWPNRTTFSIIYVCRTLPSITQVWPTAGINQTRRSFFIVTRPRVKPLFGFLFGLGFRECYENMSMRIFFKFCFERIILLIINYNQEQDLDT